MRGNQQGTSAGTELEGYASSNDHPPLYALFSTGDGNVVWIDTAALWDVIWGGDADDEFDPVVWGGSATDDFPHVVVYGG